MLHYYFQKALVEELSPSEFMNVIRIILHKAPTHCGADGEEHYAAVDKRVRNLFKNIEVVEEESDEDQEVEEIIAAYKPQRNQAVAPFQVLNEDIKQITNQLNKDNEHLDFLNENNIEDTDSEFDISL